VLLSGKQHIQISRPFVALSGRVRPTVAFFFNNKKVTQCALLYTQKKIQPKNVNILFGRVSLAASKSEEPTTA
jgi:hypothetical protein